MINIFDTHSHYAEPAFDNDRFELLDSLPEKGIKYIMIASTDIPSIKKNDEISRKYSYVYMASGIHPNDIDGIPENYLEIVENSVNSNPKVKAIGEIGIDYHYEGYDKEKQIKIFRSQIELAQKLNLPVIVHSRDACEDTMNILREYKPSGVMHCFSGSVETAKELIKLGMYIGFTGVITYKNAKKPVEALKIVPDDRLLLETDCPYMSPVPLRKYRCDSSMIAVTAEKAAEIRNTTTQEILDLTCENAIRLFLSD